MSHESTGADLKGNNEVPESGETSNQDPRDGAWQAELVKRCLIGDESAFALIADQYGGLLLRTAYLLIRDEEPAFLRAWLLKIVVNQTTSLKRQLARKAALLREQLSEQYVDITIRTAEMQRGRLEDSIDLERAVGQLPLNQRVVLVLFYYHRMTMPEIARLLGVAENTLRKRLQAALDKMRRVLQVDLAPTQNTNMAQDGANPRIGSIRRGGAR